MFWSKKKKGEKVFVGLSGGVDSAVSAALLKGQGYDVTGVFIKIALPGYPCPAGVDRVDAMRIAAHLRIPFIEIDLSKEYTDRVFADALSGFTHGETPNPDTLCNREIKFGAFFDFAMKRGAGFVATGHYAQTSGGLLYAGKDASKDQSYFLWMVPQNALAKTLFPVGNVHKTEVRALAEKFKLPNARRPDSQGLCFLGDISLDDMLTRELAPAPGKVLSESGEIIGTHEGAMRYTLGQRHGFTLTLSTTQNSHVDTPAHYVIAKDIEKNTITVSTDRFPKDASKTRVELREENWIGLPAEVGEKPQGPCFARYRYHQTLIPARYESNGSVLLDEPHYVPKGQSLVLYIKENGKERCLGGGIVNNSTLVAE